MQNLKMESALYRLTDSISRFRQIYSGKGMHLIQTLPTGVQANPRPGTMLSQRTVHPNFGCSQPLLCVPLHVVIWSYSEQGYKSATGHFVWLVLSPGIVSY